MKDAHTSSDVGPGASWEQPSSAAPLSDQELRTLSKVMNTKYSSYLEGKFFRFEIFSGAQSLRLVITLQSEDRSFFYPVEARLFYKDQKMSPRAAATLLVDYLEAYYREYLESQGEVLLPIDWTLHRFDGRELYVKAQILDQKAEELAERWLQN